MYQLIKYTKDDIPGFKDKSEWVIAEFKTKEEAEKELSKYKDSSEWHGGYGAGQGSIDTTYYIKEKI